MRLILIILLVLAIQAPAQAQDWLEWRNAENSHWTTDDKLVHSAWGYWNCNAFDKGMKLHWAILLNAAIQWGNEVKDALIPHEKLPWIGGNGFDEKDAVMGSITGAIFYVLTEYVIFHGDNYYINLDSKRGETRLRMAVYW